LKICGGGVHGPKERKSSFPRMWGKGERTGHSDAAIKRGKKEKEPEKRRPFTVMNAEGKRQSPLRDEERKIQTA